MAKYVFGIDFGTSHIGGACSKVDANGKPSGFVVFTNDESLTYICPAVDLSSPEVQEFLPHSKSCRTVFRADDGESGCEFIIGSDARDKYQFFLNDNENHSNQNYNKFESRTVPASVKTILVNHLGIDRIYNGEKPYEEFYNQNEYEIEPSEFFTTMFFKKFFLDAKTKIEEGIKGCYADVEQVDFVIGTPPGCGEKYAVELIKCVKNGFYLAIKANDPKRAKTLRMRGRTSPEPLLAGYAWFSAVEGVLDEGETAFIVDIGAGTTDWTFVTRRQNKIVPLLCDDNGKPIESMGTNFGTSGNAFDKAIKTDLDVFFRLKGLENAIMLEQMARGIKEKLHDPKNSLHFFTAQIDKKDPSKPITVVADGKTRRLTSFNFNVFKRPELMIVGEDGEDRYITFEEYRDLETLAKTDARFKGFLAPNGAMLERPDYYYEPSGNPELDLFFVDLISDEGDQLNNLEKKFDNIANKTLNYFNHYRFDKTPKILFVGNGSNLTALKEHITTKLELGLETSFIHPDILELGARINKMLSLKRHYKINFSNAIAIGACLSIDKVAESSSGIVSTGVSSPIPVDANLSVAIKAALEEFGVLSEKSFVTTSKFPHLINSFGGVNCSGSQVEIAEPSENSLVVRVESAMVDAVSEAFEKLDLTRVTSAINDLQDKLDAISTNAKSASTEAVATGDKISALASEVTALAKLVKELKTTSTGYTGLTTSDRGIIESATETVITRANSNQTNTIVSRVTDSVRNIVTSSPVSSGGTASSLLSGFMSVNRVLAIISIVLGAISGGLGLVFGIISMAFPIIQGLIASSSRAGKSVKIFLHILNLLFLLSTFILSVGLYRSLTY